MARVILSEPFASQFFAGRDEVVAQGETIFALVRALDAMAPGFAEVAESKAAVALDGVAIADWSTALGSECEVLFVPRLAGG